MQLQMERLMEKKKGFFKWKKFGMPNFSKSTSALEKVEDGFEGEVEVGRQTPMDMKTRLVKGRNPHKWRRSMS